MRMVGRTTSPQDNGRIRALLAGTARGLSWRAHFRAMVGLVRVGPERRRPGVGPGRDAAGWSGGAPGMDEVTRILSAIERGDEQAAEQLLPLVYDELRKLAAQKLAQEKPGQTLQPTALVRAAAGAIRGASDRFRRRSGRA